MNNLFIFIGRITKDLELRYTKENKAVLDFVIAINNGKDDTSYIKLTSFGSVAELMAKYCKKGDLVGTQGLIKNHNWEDKNGNKHYDYTFLATKVTFLQLKQKEESKETNVQRSEVIEEKVETSDPYQEINNQIKLDDLDLNDSLPF